MEAIILYLAIVVCSPLQSSTVRFYSKTSNNIIAFNLIKSLSALLLFVVVGIWSFSFHLDTLVFASIYGVSLVISMHFGYKALDVGPMALTSLIVAFSVVIPIAYGL